MAVFLLQGVYGHFQVKTKTLTATGCRRSVPLFWWLHENWLSWRSLDGVLRSSPVVRRPQLERETPSSKGH